MYIYLYSTPYFHFHTAQRYQTLQDSCCMYRETKAVFDDRRFGACQGYFLFDSYLIIVRKVGFFSPPLSPLQLLHSIAIYILLCSIAERIIVLMYTPQKIFPFTFKFNGI